MGVYIVGFGYIEADDKHIKDIVKLLSTEINLAEITVSVERISFKLEGYGTIDYKILETIKEWSIKQDAHITIQVKEFIECDEGFFYETGE